MTDEELCALFLEMYGGGMKDPREERQPQPAAPRLQPAPGPQPAPPARPRTKFFMKKLRGTANYVENHSNEFFEAMARQHPSFQVVSTTAVSLPDSVCIYITYSLSE